MPVYHRTQRLQIYGEKPEVTQLFNDRYRMVVRCKAARDTEAWYNDNKSQIFADFGTLYNAQMSIDGIDSRTGEAYDNMVLVSNAVGYTSTGEYVVTFVYETLTATWTKEQEDTVSSTDNGLRIVERSEVATIVATAPYDEDNIGTSTITSGGKTLYLAGFKDETKAEADAQIGRVTTQWLEAGTLSETLDNVGSQKAKVIEAIGPDPATPTGYSLASKQESSFNGFQTNRYTFLKPSILSLQQDFNNGLKRVSVQTFGMTDTSVSDELSEITTDHKLISQDEGNYEGIKTSTFQYQIDEAVTEDYELNGLKRISLIELSVSDFTAQTIGSVSSSAPTSGLYLGTQQIDNGGSIKVRESVWLEAGTLNVQRRSESEGVYRVTTTFLGAEGTVVGPIVARVEDDYEGLKTITVLSMQDASGSSLVDSGAQPVASHSSLSEFSYPGVVTISSETLAGTGGTYTFIAKDFSLQPPVVAKVPITIKVSFQTTSAISYTATDGLWNPTTWAEGSSKGIGWNYIPFSISKGFRGYRIDPTQTNSYSDHGTPGTGGTWDMISGKRIFGNTTYAIQVVGGPVNPEGGQYTLDYSVSLAFSDVNGVPYYKHKEIVSTIPTQ